MLNTQHNQLFINIVKDILSRDRFEDDIILKICEYMIEGNLVIRYNHVPKTLNYEEKLKFSPETIDWDIEYGNNTNLCQLYLHSLEPMKYLIQGYEVTRKEEYIKLAVNILKSWLAYSESNNENKFTWYDHCVSDRVLYLIYLKELILINNLQKYFDIDEIDQLQFKHGEFLNNDLNYTTQNHGTMMDRSLYLLSYYTDYPFSDSWRNKALSRLKESFHRDFSKEMVNWENSSSYHLFNFDLYLGIEKGILNILGDSLGDDIKPLINKGVDYMVHLSKPDLFFPLLGDGAKTSLLNIKKHKSFKYVENHKELEYVLSRGNTGNKPSELFKVYDEEGYAFMRNSWDYKNHINKITYASFVSGYKLKNHKHGDDLSFTLFSHGRDIFVDCGTYTYQAGDFRKHFMSALSHNTVIVDGVTYPFILGNPENTGIIDYGEETDYFYVVGKNDLYKGVNITRYFYFLKSGKVIIVDDVVSDKKHTYSQLFHLSHKLNTDKIKLGNKNIQLTEKDINIKLEQINNTDLIIHRGNREKADLGLVSEGFNSIEETTTLEYQVNGKSARFVTLISVTDNNSNETFNVINNGNELSVTDNDSIFTIKLTSHNRGIEKIVELQEQKLDDNTYRFTILGAESNSEYAWYIFKDGERIDVIWYNDNSILDYQFTKPGLYEVRYFIRNKNNQEDKAMYIHKNKIII